MGMGKSDLSERDEIRDELHELAKRISRIERLLAENKNRNPKEELNATDRNEDFDFKLSGNSDNSIEFKLGEYGMAWLGNIVLLFGIGFLVQYLQSSGKPVISAVVGFGAVAAIYLIHYLTQNHWYTSPDFCRTMGIFYCIM